MKITKSQLKELIMKEIQESSFMDKVDKEKSAVKSRFEKEFKRTKPDASPEEVEEYAALAARAVPMVARAIGTNAAIDKVTGEDEEVEEGKFKAVKKVGKKVYDKVAPHVKDIAKQAAAGAIEKGAEAAKEKIGKKFGNKQKDEGGEGSGRPAKPGGAKDIENKMMSAADAANAKMDAAEKAMKAKKKKKKAKEEGRYHTQVNIPKGTWKTTVKEVKQWMRKLEENRYKKVYNADVRRVAWMVNNEGIELSAMPKSMSKKWTKAQYGRERQLATEFIKHLESKQVNETKLRESIRNIIKRLI